MLGGWQGYVQDELAGEYYEIYFDTAQYWPFKKHTNYSDFIFDYRINNDSLLTKLSEQFHDSFDYLGSINFDQNDRLLIRLENSNNTFYRLSNEKIPVKLNSYEQISHSDFLSGFEQRKKDFLISKGYFTKEQYYKELEKAKEGVN